LMRDSEREQALEESKSAIERTGPRLVQSYLKDLGILYSKQEAIVSNVRVAKGRRVER
jgi:hypothetical protein